VRRLPLSLSAPAVVLASAGLAFGAGCSSSGSDATTASSTIAPAPEKILVSNATVTAGLAKLGTIAASAASQMKTSPAAAKTSAKRAAEQWEAIEGRIKKNDTAAYLEFEDALSDLRVGAQDKDAAKVARGAASVAATTSAYLTKYPG
jgi:hypothetical protein